MGWVSNIAGSFTGHNQREAANEAANQLNASKQEAYGFLDPYAKAGQTALSPLQALLTGTGSNGEQLSSDQRNQALYQNPGYQFALDQAMKGVQSSQASKGNLLSGGAQKEIAQYSSGLASQNYNDYIGQLFQFAGMGQNAANAKANVALGVANPLAESAFSSGIASDVGANRTMQALSSGGGFLAGLFKGQGAPAGAGGASGAEAGVNPAMLMAT